MNSQLQKRFQKRLLSIIQSKLDTDPLIPTIMTKLNCSKSAAYKRTQCIRFISTREVLQLVSEFKLQPDEVLSLFEEVMENSKKS